MKRFLLCLLLILCTMLLCSGCALTDFLFGEPTPEIVQDENILHDQQYVVENVYLGVVLPQGGGNSTNMQNLQIAQQLAAAIVNNSYALDWDIAQSAGISGYGLAQIELIYADSTSSEALAQTYPARWAASQLIDLGVVALIGAADEYTTSEVAIRARQNWLPMICGSVAKDSLTNGSYDFGSWFNNLAVTPAQESDLFFSYLRNLNQTQAAGISKVAIIYEETAENEEFLTAFNNSAASYAFEVAARISYPSNATQISQQVQRLILSGAQVVFHVGNAGHLSQFATAYQLAEYEPQAALIYNGTYADSSFRSTVKELEQDFWGGCSVAPLPLQDAQEENPSVELYQYLNQLYRQQSGQDMDNAALGEFSAIIVMAQAIGQAGTTDAVTVSEVLKSSTFPAPYLAAGEIRFNENGSLSSACGVIALVIDGTAYEVYRK